MEDSLRYDISGRLIRVHLAGEYSEAGLVAHPCRDVDEAYVFLGVER